MAVRRLSPIFRVVVAVCILLFPVLPQVGHASSIRCVQFAFDSFHIDVHGRQFLDFVAEDINANPSRAWTIEGHTCNIGTNEYNMILSQKRAEAVKAYLMSSGVRESRFGEITGYGAHMPTYDNRWPEGRQLNRRVLVWPE